MERGKGRTREFTEGVAADLRLIKVNKPFKSIIKLAFKGRNPRVHKLSHQQRPKGGDGDEREALNSVQPPPSEHRNRPTYFQIKVRAPGSPGRSRCDFK